jgi:hypothetical protein
VPSRQNVKLEGELTLATACRLAAELKRIEPTDPSAHGRPAGPELHRLLRTRRAGQGAPSRASREPPARPHKGDGEIAHPGSGQARTRSRPSRPCSSKSSHPRVWPGRITSAGPPAALATDTRSNVSPRAARELRRVPAREPAKERTEHEPHLGRKRDIGGDADADAKRQADHRSEPDGGSALHVRECMFAS